MLRVLLISAICVTYLAASPSAVAARRFQLALWLSDDPTYSDLGWLNHDQDQPPAPRRSVFFIPPSAVNRPESPNDWVDQYAARSEAEWPVVDVAVRASVRALLDLKNHDWTRIDAVVIDEPYLPEGDGGINPCQRSESADRVRMVQRVLVNAAAVVREHPTVRFWVNFSAPEIEWMKGGLCHSVLLNDWYMDVVSIDIYGEEFAVVESSYNDLLSNRPTAYQQLALVPGTYSAPATGFAAITVAQRLQGFFDYANAMNQSCSLQIGRVGVTRSADGCPIWLVAGFWGGSTILPGDDRAPMFLLSSAAIKDRWKQEFDEPRLHALLGRVEVLDVPTGVISGWVVNRTAPDELPQVDVWLNGQIYLGGTLPNQQRADVATGTGISLAGYTFTIPPQYRQLPGCHEYVAYAVHPANSGHHPVLGSTIYCR
jgi:hypothetical protein